jgi:hypothetical protein
MRAARTRAEGTPWVARQRSAAAAPQPEEPHNRPPPAVEEAKRSAARAPVSRECASARSCNSNHDHEPVPGTGSWLFASGRWCSDSEIRKPLRRPLMRTSESKCPLLNPKFATGLAALVLHFSESARAQRSLRLALNLLTHQRTTSVCRNGLPPSLSVSLA